jgi:hypothetical protein
MRRLPALFIASGRLFICAKASELDPIQSIAATPVALVVKKDLRLCTHLLFFGAVTTLEELRRIEQEGCKLNFA